MSAPAASPSLVLAGRLDAVPLGDVLQMLAGGRRDGVLEVEREEPSERGEIELRLGKVIRARVWPYNVPLGDLLMRRDVSPDVLGQALVAQSAGRAWKPLGTLLVEMGAVAPHVLADALAEQIEGAAAQILGWERGVFRFRTAAALCRRPVPAIGVALEAHELLLQAAHHGDRGMHLHG